MDVTTATRLVEIRKKNGLSQEQLAEKLGVSRQAVSKWERSEASPDTDNLIALAKLYNMSLDELLGMENGAGEAEHPSPAEDINEDSGFGAEPEDSAFNDSADNDKYFNGKGVEVHDNGDHVHIGFDGIHVIDKDGSEVHVGLGGIYVNDKKNGDVVESKKDGIYVNGEKKDFFGGHGHSMIFSGIISILCIVGFIVTGAVTGGWSWCWLILLFIPILTSIEPAIRKRNPSEFCYPVLATVVFLYFGLFNDMWHPMWVVFLTIPIYYTLCSLFRRKK